MKNTIRFKRSSIVIIIIIISVFSLIECIGKENNKLVSTPDSFSQFAGSAKCAGCHKDIYDHHIHTPHFLTSQPALEKNILGSFEKGRNTYYFNPSLYISVEKKDTGFFQVAYYKGAKKFSGKIDMVIGSGVKGQSFLYWHNNFPFQLPLTYYSFANQWGNSPGYPNKVQFNRPITSRCLECHTTFMEKISDPSQEHEEFSTERIIFGVDCEKCHGPGAQHVRFQMQNPNETKGKYIINPASFSRQQKLDLCALCHGGRMNKTKPSFSFKAGDALSDYFNVDTTNPSAINNNDIDVHGNQYGLMRASKCFRLSGSLTCNTCHNTHNNERGNVALFSQRCMSCHNKEHGNFCTINPSLVSSIKDNCIDCHMPAKPSRAIIIVAPEQNMVRAAEFRSHFISIYREESKKFIEEKGKPR